MTTREALSEINAVLDELLMGGEGELDPDTRFAVTFLKATATASVILAMPKALPRLAMCRWQVLYRLASCALWLAR